MGSELWGMNLEAVVSLAGDLDEGANALDEACSALTAALDSVTAAGPDIDEYRSMCHGAVFPMLRSAASALREAAKTAIRNADAQRDASTAGGTGVGSAGPVLAAASSGRVGGTNGPLAAPAGAAVGASGAAMGAAGASPTKKDPNLPNPDGKGMDVYREPGPQPFTSGIGKMRPGTDPIPIPKAPTWVPADAGADMPESGDFAGKSRFDSWKAKNPGDSVKKFLGLRDVDTRWRDLVRAATLLYPKWPHGASNLRHYLEQSGETRNIDVDALIKDCPGFRQELDDFRSEIAKSAVDKARIAGVTGPVTFPINTDYEQNHSVGWDESGDWHLATGTFDYGLSGYVTVYPPETPGGLWTWEMTDRVNFRDRYNFDGGGAGKVEGFGFTDEDLMELHWAGLAQEYNMVGRSSESWAKGWYQ